jgi:sugar lactone lactonase YvrE
MIRFVVACLVSIAFAASSFAEEPTGDLAFKLTTVKFDHYAEAPGYSEGPTWRIGDVYFCSGALLRVDASKKVQKFLEIGPAGTVLKEDGHLLICDNQNKALLDLAPDGKVGVLADRFEAETLRSLNDLTIDARGNVYWTDPEGSTPEKPAGHIYRMRPNGRVERMATGLAFPNGLEVDPASHYLYVIESQTKKILRYDLPPDNELLGQPTMFYDLGGSGGDGCAFDAQGNLWVADFHRPETQTGRITVLSPDAKVLAYLPLPSKLVSNICFGGIANDEIFCTTGEPAGIFHANVRVKGFIGHPGKPAPILRYLNVVPLLQTADSETLRKMAQVAADAKVEGGKFPEAVRQQLRMLTATVSDPRIRVITEKLLPSFEQAALQTAADQPLLNEVKRLNGKVTFEVNAPTWLRSLASDAGLPVFRRIVELDLNENTDGHAIPVPKKAEDRVTDDWLKKLAGQDLLRRLELSGTAVTSAGLIHLKELKDLERLNVCLTATDDRGFEHLAGLTKMRRMTVCASKITGSGFEHLQGMQQLESINLHSSPASDAGLQAIGKLTSLKRLEIVHTNVTDAGLVHLASLVNLQQLHVHGPKTTEAALPFLGQLKELYQLDVYDHAASNQTLEQAAKLPKLRMLMLPQAVCDDAGVKHLVNVQTLEEVSLNSPNVTDASIESLSSLKNLRKLDVSGTKITEAGRKRLRELLPKAVISPQ